MNIDLQSVQAYIDERWNEDGEHFTVISATHNARKVYGCHDYEGLVLVHDDKRDRYLIGSCWDSGVMSDAFAFDDPDLEGFFKALREVLKGEQK